jgi:transposase
MEVVYRRCCGLDVHKKTVVACLVVSGEESALSKQTRTFGTMTEDLQALADWLEEVGCTHVAMESTGVYWKPVYNLLEDRFQLLLVNPEQIKAYARPKTDVRDAEWIADLLRHGLLKGSFVPTREQRELRELTRYRASLIRERAAEMNRLQKVLEGANIKLGSVVSNINGQSARAMLEQLVAGSTDLTAIAELAQGRMREKIPLLEKALMGRFGAHQRFLVAHQLAHIDSLDELIEQVSGEIEERMRPFEEAVERLDTIPGVGRETAEVIVAEIGVEMSRFGSPERLSSWAKLCPEKSESAGKEHRAQIGHGNKALQAALVQAANAVSRSRKSYLSALYHRLASRRGKNKAVIAVAHAILVIVYHLLDRKESYRDLGPNYFDQRNKEAVRRRLVRQLQDLGYKVTAEPDPVAA